MSSCADQLLKELCTSYKYRLKNFDSWPSEFAKEKTAKAGFIHTGVNDVVICPFRKIKLLAICR